MPMAGHGTKSDDVVGVWRLVGRSAISVEPHQFWVKLPLWQEAEFGGSRGMAAWVYINSMIAAMVSRTSYEHEENWTFELMALVLWLATNQ